jgi:hypothetical protein
LSQQRIVQGRRFRRGGVALQQFDARIFAAHIDLNYL